MWLRARACQEVFITPIFARPSSYRTLSNNFQITFFMFEKHSYYFNEMRGSNDCPNPTEDNCNETCREFQSNTHGLWKCCLVFPPCHLPMPCLWTRIAHVCARGRKGTIRECVPNRYLLKHLPIGRPNHMCWNELHTRESKKSLSLKT